MTQHNRLQMVVSSFLGSARRGALARKARARRQMALEMLESRQLLAASVTNTLSVDSNPATAGQNVTFAALVAPSDSGTPTGQVVFTVDGVDQSPVDLQDVGGQEEAVFSTDSLSPGGHTISASYAGDANYDPAASNSMLELVNSATASVGSSTAVSASPAPATVGGSVTFTAVVSPSDNGTPTGQVIFNIDGVSQSPVALQEVDGQEVATFTTDSLTQGTHSVAAFYTGDDTYLASGAGTLSETIQGTTTTTLSPSESSATVGDSVTFTATVGTPGSGTPTGQVVFTIDGVDQTPVDLQDVSGQEVATFTTDSLAIGSHSVTATYNGDSNFVGSASDPLSLDVNQATTTTTVSASESPATVGDSVTFTAVVSTDASLTPTGQVVFTVDGTDQAPVDLRNVDGQEVATFTSDSLGVGTHSITATYNGDTNFNTSASDPVSLDVNQAGTTTTVSASESSATVGDSVTFTAVVAATGTGTPTGQVVFTVDGTDQALVDLQEVDGQEVATFTTDSLAVGTHSVTATYNGDTNFSTSASDPLSLDVNAVATTTTLTPSDNPAVVGQSVTFTAVIGAQDGSMPTGQVVFTIDGVDQAPVDLQAVDGQQVVSFTIDSLSQGAHTVVATYNGDDTHGTSSSDPLTEQVNNSAATVSTSVTVNASANPATVGDSVTFTAVVTPGDSGTPTGQVVFTVDGVDQAPVDVQTVDGQQVASFTTDALTQGSHTVVATYDGDDTYLVSSSDTLNQTIQATTTTTLSAPASSVTVGDSVTFTAVVATGGTGAPTGQVVFTLDGVDQAPVDLQLVDGQEVATFTASGLGVGTHSISARYNGSSDFAASASDPLSLNVNQAATTTTLTSSANPSASGDNVTLTAVISTTASLTPTGQVVFKIDGVAQTPVTLQNVGGQEVATFQTSTLGLGTHTVSTSYSGDTNFSASASDSLSQVTLTNAQAGAPTLAAASQTGQGSSSGYTKDNGSASAPLVLAIPNPSSALFYRLYDVTNPSNPVLLAGPVQLSSGQITVNGQTLADGTHQLAYTTASDSNSTASSLSQAGTVIVQTSLTATINPGGNYLTVLPTNQVVVTFDHWLAGLVADQSNGSGFTSAPFAVMLIPSGPHGQATAAQTGSLWSAPSGVDGGDLPIPATLVYHQNADGTSTITLTPQQSLASDVYLISVSASLTDLAGNTLTNASGGLGTLYSSFALHATPADSTPLAVMSVTANNGSVVINNSLISQPDTIAVHFNKPLDLWTANDTTVQLWQQNADGTYQRLQATAIYSASTNSVYLTPGTILSPGTTYIVAAYVGISDDQAFPSVGGTLSQNFYTSFQVNAAGGGAGQSPLTVLGTNPANGTVARSPLGYASVTFSEAVDLSSFGRYSAMLIPHTGGVTTGDSGYADVPYNALVAFNPNTNQLIIVPTGILTDNTIDLLALSNITATNGDPLTNPSGSLPVYSSFLLSSTAQPASMSSATPAVITGQPTVAGVLGAVVTTDDSSGKTTDRSSNS